MKTGGNEQVIIRNSNEVPIDLDGWILKDRAGNIFALAGIVSAKGEIKITMAEPTMPLNNDGDEVLLIDGDGVVRSQVAYGEYDVRSGGWVEVAKTGQ